MSRELSARRWLLERLLADLYERVSALEASAVGEHQGLRLVAPGEPDEPTDPSAPPATPPGDP